MSVMNNLLDTLSCQPPAVTPELVEQTASNDFGLNGKAQPLGGERDRNFLLHSGGADVLIKVANASEPDELLEFQSMALAHIARHDPDLPVPRGIRTRDGRNWAELSGPGGQRYRVRAFDFLHGLALNDAPDDPRLMRRLGGMLAKLGRALHGFFHPSADHPLAWDLKRLDLLADLVPAIGDPDQRRAVEQAIERFVQHVKPKLTGLRSQVIHNDVSFHNTVVDLGAPFEVAGIFDFGDLIYAPLIQDLAVTASEVPVSRRDPLARSAEIVAGFDRVTPLEDAEFELLPDLIASRLALGILIDNWSEQHIAWDDDRDYLAGWHVHAIAVLQNINAMQAGELESMMRAACGRPPARPLTGTRIRSAGNGVDDLMRRRLTHLGNGRYVSYARPVHTVRGEGVWLYDAEGGAYLDAYNNVPHVGHCHPRVIEAVARQTATLNTNTRYVYDAIVSYAERLTRTLPEGLDLCYFVSSGSEANDLAWQLAKVCTGNDGALIIEHAYHGVTDAVFELSPSGRNAPVDRVSHIATLPAPDDYRGKWKRDIEDRGRHYAVFCDQALAKLRRNGHEPAAFFIDSILSSNGIFVPPPGYLEEVFGRVRAAGGLCVADEVQAGFGRLGKTMWGFETGGVVPDIVTFGKPIANGYPMGLVVTTRAIADRFDEHAEYFSTTGGNPVACASALAVLDVLQDEDLVVRAERVGERIMEGLRQLADQHTLIGDVRGSGLFIGVELVEDRATLEPSAAGARAVADTLRDHNVLVGIDGAYDNVIKIRPPMVFSDEHAGRLLQSLDKALEMY
jgi:4-aminobutyrate aminotransferase-like enzyme/Ser/Thr protein kinase RdoA (MazF antagonist)